jgi:hypothetical protein
MKIYHFLLIILVIILIPFGCRKPFDGVDAILSNSYITYRVSGQIIDANSAASNPYPANSSVTLSGDAVTKGLIYTESGEQILTGNNNVQVTSNVFTLVVKPYYVISSNSPLKLSIAVSAPGYNSNNKDVTITNLDSLQYLTIKILNTTNIPTGVALNNATVAGITNGTTTTPTNIAVTNNAGGNTTPAAQIAIPANTTFRDASGNVIASSAPMNFNVASYSGSSSDATTSVPGGLSNVSTTSGNNSSFTLGAAVDINAFIGGTAIKQLSQPIICKLILDSNTLNPITHASIKIGDSIETWSNDATTNSWKKEGSSIIFRDPVSSKMATNMSVTHFSTWMTAYSSNICSNPFTVKYTTTDSSISTMFINIISQSGNKQVLDSKKVSVKNGDVIQFSLPQGIDFTVNMYAGSIAIGTPVATANLTACSNSTTLNYTVPANRPSLYFDLQTYCSNGIFRYTGPIDYKVNGTNLWQTFTPSINGTMTTTLLDWNTTYDFRIVYKGAEYIRSKQVLQTEFRQTAGTTNSWYYWGKDPANKQTFFNSPTACN